MSISRMMASQVQRGENTISTLGKYAPVFFKCTTEILLVPVEHEILEMEDQINF